MRLCIAPRWWRKHGRALGKSEGFPDFVMDMLESQLNKVA